jgi:hypothetical protein
MNDALAQSLATLIGTLSTVALMAGTYYFGPRRREERRQSREIDQAYRENDYRDGGDRRRNRDSDYRGPERRGRYTEDDEGDSR